MARIVEVSWQKFIFKPICSHVKIHFVMAVSYILQYHNKNTKISELHIEYVGIMIVYMWHVLDIPRLWFTINLWSLNYLTYFGRHCAIWLQLMDNRQTCFPCSIWIFVTNFPIFIFTALRYMTCSWNFKWRK